MRWLTILSTLLAGILGAAGTVGAALAAHGGDPRLLGTAAAMALVHAPAILALGLAGGGRIASPLVPVAALGLGVLLFSGDLAARAYLAASLFPGAAPTGGTLVILGWLSVAVLGLVGSGRGSAD